MTVFKAEALSFKFGKNSREILSDLNFEIYEGEFAAIIGPNGTGKTTLLNILLGYYAEYEGSVVFFGEEICKADMMKLAESRGYIPQENEAGIDITVFEYLKLSKIDPALMTDNEVEKILEKYGLLELRYHKVSMLSGGQSRLLQLALMLARKPRVLLLDEPASFLDVDNQKRFFELLKAEAGEKKITIVAILHDLNAAAHYCDRIMLLNDGKIVKFDSPGAVLNSETIGSVFFTFYDKKRP
ncbi:MAG: ABC transporter ATP-binding protein [Candidatus Wallbacteria bacterium]